LTAIISFYVVPLREGDEGSVSELIAQSVRVIKGKGFKFQVTPASTVFEAPGVDEGLRAVAEAINSLRSAGVARVVAGIKVDVRWDKDLVMEEMPEKVLSKIP